MDSRKHAMQNRILLAAVQCLEQGGLEAVTVRNVTDLAGVNGAAVNYHFGSKENLLLQVSHRCVGVSFVEPLREMDRLLAEMPSRRSAIVRFLSHYLREMLSQTRALEVCFHNALIRQDYSDGTFPAIQQLLEGFLERARPILKPGSEEELRASVVQIWSTIFLIALIPQGFDGFKGSRFVDSEDVDGYVSRLAEHYFLPG